MTMGHRNRRMNRRYRQDWFRLSFSQLEIQSWGARAD
jgi:hypothetical protein